MSQRILTSRSPALRGVLKACAGVSICLALTACNKPEPRSYNFFMEDRLAREGTLVRCDENSEASQVDLECANARRAAVMLALREERERHEVFERESERKMDQLRRELEERQRIAREAALEAIRQEREAYEEMWRRQSGSLPGAVDTEPDDGLDLIELPGNLRPEPAVEQESIR